MNLNNIEGVQLATIVMNNWTKQILILYFYPKRHRMSKNKLNLSSGEEDVRVFSRSNWICIIIESAYVLR